MSKKAVRRILATVLAFTMMWGMCLSVSAAGGATSCDAANQESTDYFYGERDYWLVEGLDDIDINSLEAGRYIDYDKWTILNGAVDNAYNALNDNYYRNCQNESKEENFGNNCGCKVLYDAWVDAVEDFEAAIEVSDGSNYVAPVGPCTPSVSGNSIPTSSTSAPSSDVETVEVVEKTPENDFGTFMEATTTDVTKALEQINIAVATGDTAKAQALRAEGVTVDTGVWHSFNVSVYEQIEKSGIPVTLTFTYGHMRWKVTIPAGAKVTELCDENGWCGFLNLAAHYGFELL